MATSINIRMNDELEMKLKRTLGELKTSTPNGSEVSNSTIIRGALVDFFKKRENEKKGYKKIVFNLKKKSDKEIYLIDSTINKISNDLENILSKDDPGYLFIHDLLSDISIETLSELIERKKAEKLRGEK